MSGQRALGRSVLAGTSDTPGLDTDLLLEHATGLSTAAQFARPELVVPASDLEAFQAALERRAAGEPIAYIIGRKSFRTVELAVDRRVLVPRPETELLVEAGLVALRRMCGRVRLLDVGTGSGAVALSLVAELPADMMNRVEVVACDISHEALQVAEGNQQGLVFGKRVDFVASDLLSNVSGTFDVILANLPYLRRDQRDPSTADEPDLALYAGVDGLDQYRRLLPQAGRRLTDGGVIACEIDPGQSDKMVRLSADNIGGLIEVLPDLAGRERIVIAGSVDIVRTVVDTWPYGA